MQIWVCISTRHIGNPEQVRRLVGAVQKSLRPKARLTNNGVIVAESVVESAAEDEDRIQQGVDQVMAAVQSSAAQRPSQRPRQKTTRLNMRQEPTREVVTRISTAGDRAWGINVGRYASRYQAEKVLLKTALEEMSTLDGTQRKVIQTSKGFDAKFLGMSQESADLACQRLRARNMACSPVGPS